MRRGRKGFGVRVGDVSLQTLTSLGCVGGKECHSALGFGGGGQQYSLCFCVSSAQEEWAQSCPHLPHT